MKRTILLPLSALAAILLAAPLALTRPAQAAATPPAPQGRAIDNFRAADRNGDGRLSRSEAEQSLPQMAQRFDALDTNQDGQITLEELQTLRSAMQGAMRPAQAGQGMRGNTDPAQRGKGLQGAGQGGMRGANAMPMRARGPGGAAQATPVSQRGTNCALSDVNGDGRFTLADADARGPGFKQRFASADRNADGALDAAERAALCPR